MSIIILIMDQFPISNRKFVILADSFVVCNIKFSWVYVETIQSGKPTKIPKQHKKYTVALKYILREPYYVCYIVTSWKLYDLLIKKTICNWDEIVRSISPPKKIWVTTKLRIIKFGFILRIFMKIELSPYHIFNALRI